MDISYEAASIYIRDELYNHVAWTITDGNEILQDNRRVKLSNREHEKVLNVSQELMAQVSHVPMPKHVGLALHVIKQTRSKDLVQILNKFGHTISYDDAQRYLTTFARDVNLQTTELGLFKAANCITSLFTQCALDNLRV
jgi:hypothetical protein